MVKSFWTKVHTTKLYLFQPRQSQTINLVKKKKLTKKKERKADFKIKIINILFEPALQCRPAFNHRKHNLEGMRQLIFRKSGCTSLCCNISLLVFDDPSRCSDILKDISNLPHMLSESFQIIKSRGIKFDVIISKMVF